MSVLRQLNLVSQQRLDIPHLRLIESAGAGDFDTVVGRILASDRPYVVRGFTINTNAVGTQAHLLQLNVSDSIAINLNASESGSFLWIEPSRAPEVLDGAINRSVTGAFVAGLTNYVGLDFIRQLDPKTSDLVKIKDAVTGVESPLVMPLGKVLNYRIVITTVPFSAQENIIPVARVTVDSTGIATAIQDARNSLFSLARGGDAPNPDSFYNWPGGRNEASFRGQKDWQDAVMTRIWELGGGTKWYANTADRNVNLSYTGTPFPNGDYWTYNAGLQTASWQGLRFVFDGGLNGATYNDVGAGSTPIADGWAIYVDLDRSQNRISPTNPLTVSFGPLANVGTGTTPGSRWILAWRVGNLLYTKGWRYPVGTTFTPASTTALGVVRLNQTPGNALTPTVVSIMANGRIEVTSTGSAVAATFIGGGSGGGVDALAGLGAAWAVRGRGNATPNSAGGRFENLAISTGIGVSAEAVTAGLFTGFGPNSLGIEAVATGIAAIRATGGTGTTAGIFIGGNSAGVSQPAGPGLTATGGGGSEVAQGARFFGGTGTFADADGLISTGGNGLYGGRGGRFVGTIGSSGVAASGAGGAAAYQAITSGNEAGWEYESTKQGVLIVPLVDLQLDAGAWTANALALVGSGGGISVPHWTQGTVSAAPGGVLSGKIPMPRGAFITGVELWIENQTGGNYSGGSLTIQRVVYSGTGVPTIANVLNAAALPTVATGTNGWVAYSGISAQALARGRPGVNGSSYYSVRYQPSSTGAGSVRLAALRILYSYLESDFMA